MIGGLAWQGGVSQYTICIVTGNLRRLGLYRNTVQSIVTRGAGAGRKRALAQARGVRAALRRGAGRRALGRWARGARAATRPPGLRHDAGQAATRQGGSATIRPDPPTTQPRARAAWACLCAQAGPS